MLTLLLMSCAFITTDEREEHLDPDGDGVLFPDDCDDLDPTIGTARWYADADGDGFGDPAIVSTACERPELFVADDSDCDDGDPTIAPGAQERCDGADDDCDARVDEDPIDPATFFRDDDGDGFGVAEDTELACEAPEGFAAVEGDCDDSAATAYPDAEVICGDGLDNDCDGLGDCGLALSGVAEVDSEWIRVDGDGSAPLHGAIVGGRDLTGDGAPDILVGSRDGSDGSVTPGVALLFAAPFGGSIEPEDAAFRLYGEHDEDLTSSALAIEDMDGDGVVDVIVGGPEAASDFGGTIYVALGPITEDVLLGSSANVLRILGENANDLVGSSLLTADFTDDGVADLLVGAPGYHNNDYGRLYLLEGPLPRRSDQIDGVAGHVIDAPSWLFDAQLGQRLLPAGDIDGDGREDIVLGMPDAVSGAGLVSLITQRITGDVSLTAVQETAFLHQGADDVDFGATAAGVGDVDGDGYGELVIGAPLWSEGSRNSVGKLWLLAGDDLRTANGNGTDHEDEAIATFVGASAHWKVGAAAHGPGDLDGDGYGELALGVPGYTPSGPEVGGLLLFQGPLSGALSASDAVYSFQGVVSNGVLGVELGSLGDLDGLGLPELFAYAPDGDGSFFILPADGL
ncbi:MAG: FG-GAP repeat protein [Alphaproteobacteria bacterium]|nr:FG-GAP repeat protein [Alphaproteobacteria bacterium]